MSRWFRFHADAMRNPKVARLTDKEFRLWVELMSVAAENDGAIPPLDDLKHLLKRRLDHLSTGIERLISIGLIDALAVGYEPHNWSKFQYKSDVSTGRVHKHRAKRNVSETPPDTEADTEADTEVPLDKSKGPEADSDQVFWSDAKTYLGRHGCKNPGSLIGKWVRDFTKPAAAQAITAAQLDRAVEPISFIEKTLRNGRVRENAEILIPV